MPRARARMRTHTRARTHMRAHVPPQNFRLEISLQLTFLKHRS